MFKKKHIFEIKTLNSAFQHFLVIIVFILSMTTILILHKLFLISKAIACFYHSFTHPHISELAFVVSLSAFSLGTRYFLELSE